jgi:hypothetical protein
MQSQEAGLAGVVTGESSGSASGSGSGAEGEGGMDAAQTVLPCPRPPRALFVVPAPGSLAGHEEPSAVLALLDGGEVVAFDLPANCNTGSAAAGRASAGRGGASGTRPRQAAAPHALQPEFQLAPRVTAARLRIIPIGRVPLQGLQVNGGRAADGLRAKQWGLNLASGRVSNIAKLLQGPTLRHSIVLCWPCLTPYLNGADAPLDQTLTGGQHDWTAGLGDGTEGGRPRPHAWRRPAGDAARQRAGQRCVAAPRDGRAPRAARRERHHRHPLLHRPQGWRRAPVGRFWGRAGAAGRRAECRGVGSAGGARGGGGASLHA